MNTNNGGNNGKVNPKINVNINAKGGPYIQGQQFQPNTNYNQVFQNRQFVGPQPGPISLGRMYTPQNQPYGNTGNTISYFNPVSFMQPQQPQQPHGLYQNPFGVPRQLQQPQSHFNQPQQPQPQQMKMQLPTSQQPQQPQQQPSQQQQQQQQMAQTQAQQPQQTHFQVFNIDSFEDASQTVDRVLQQATISAIGGLWESLTKLAISQPYNKGNITKLKIRLINDGLTKLDAMTQDPTNIWIEVINKLFCDLRELRDDQGDDFKKALLNGVESCIRFLKANIIVQNMAMFQETFFILFERLRFETPDIIKLLNGIFLLILRYIATPDFYDKLSEYTDKILDCFVQSAQALVDVSRKRDIDKEDNLIQNSFKPICDLVSSFINLSMNSLVNIKTKSSGSIEGLRRIIAKYKSVAELEIKGLPKAHVSDIYTLKFRLIYGITLFSNSVGEEYDSITASAELLGRYKKEHILTCEIPNILRKIISFTPNRKPQVSQKMCENFDIFTDETIFFGSTTEQLSDFLKQFRIFPIRFICDFMFAADINEEYMLKHILFITAKYYLDYPNVMFQIIFRIKDISLNEKIFSRAVYLETLRLYGRIISNLRSLHRQRTLTKDLGNAANTATDITNGVLGQKSLIKIDDTSTNFINDYSIIRDVFKNVLECAEILDYSPKFRDIIFHMLLCIDDRGQSGFMIDTILWDCGPLFIHILSKVDISTSSELKPIVSARLLEFVFKKIIEANESVDTVDIYVDRKEYTAKLLEKLNADNSMEVEEDKPNTEDDDEDCEDIPDSPNETQRERSLRKKRNVLLKDYLAKLLGLFKTLMDRTLMHQQFPDLIIRYTKYMCKVCTKQHPNSDVFNMNMNILRYLFEKCQKQRSGSSKFITMDTLPELSPMLRGLNRMRDFATEAELDMMSSIAITIPNTQLNKVIVDDHIPFIKTEITRHIFSSEHSASSAMALNWLSNYCESFWDKHLDPHFGEIIACLKSSIKKHQKRIASSVIHILGKLSGRCRSLLKESILPSLGKIDAIDDVTDSKGSCSIEAEFYSSQKTDSVRFNIQLGDYVARARELATSQDFDKLSDRFPMKSYYTLCRGAVLLFIDKTMPEINPEMFQEQESSEEDSQLGNTFVSLETAERNKKSYEDALMAFIGFSAQKDFKDDPKRMMDGLLSYFAVLFAENKYESTEEEERDARYIGAETIARAFVNLQCSDNKRVLAYSNRVCRRLLELIETLTGEQYSDSMNGFWKHYNKQIQSICSISKRNTKKGGLISLKFLVSNAPKEWLLLNINEVLSSIYLLADKVPIEVSNNIPKGIDYILSVLFDNRLKGNSSEEVIKKMDKYSIVRLTTSEGHLFNTIKKVLTKIESMDKDHNSNPIERLYKIHIGMEGIISPVLQKDNFSDMSSIRMRTQELLGHAFFFKHAPELFKDSVLKSVRDNILKVFEHVGMGMKNKKGFSQDEIENIIGWITLFGSTFFTKPFKDMRTTEMASFNSYLDNGMNLCLSLLEYDGFKRFPGTDSCDNIFSDAIDECFGNLCEALDKTCSTSVMLYVTANTNIIAHRLFVKNFPEFMKEHYVEYFKKIFNKITKNLEEPYLNRKIEVIKEMTATTNILFDLLKLFQLTPELVSLSINAVNVAMMKCAYNTQSIINMFIELASLKLDDFIDQLTNPNNAQLLEAIILRGKHTEKICERLYNLEKLEGTWNIKDPYVKISYANVIRTLIYRNTEILKTSKVFIEWVSAEWNNLLSVDNNRDDHPSKYYFSDIITNCFSTLCLLPETSPDELFSLVLGLDSPGTALSKITIQESIENIKTTFPLERKRQVIQRFYEICTDVAIPSNNKLLFVSAFINPMLSYCVKEGEVVIDAKLGDMLLTNVVGKDNLSEASQGYLELGGLVVELLYKLDEIPTKILSDFGEKATKVLLSRNLSDQSIQTERYLLVSRLCNEKQPNIIKKILILKILFSLLKIGAIEDKVLIDEAVDNLLPITFYWMKLDASLKNNFFAHLETLLNGDNMQRSRIFRLLLKYPNLFYIRHGMFTKHIINLKDTKPFNFDLTNLLVTWEKVRMYPNSYTEPIEIENNVAKDKGIFEGVIEMLRQEPQEDRSWSETNGNNFLRFIVNLYSSILKRQISKQSQTKQQVHDIGIFSHTHDFETVSNILKKLVMLFPKGLFSDTFYPKGVEEQSNQNTIINRVMIFKEYEMFTYNEQAFASAVLKTADLILKDRVKEIFTNFETIKSMRDSMIRTLKHLILLEDFPGYTAEQKGRLSGLFKTVNDYISDTLTKHNDPQLLLLALEVCKEVNETKPYMIEPVLKLYSTFATEKPTAIMEKATTEHVLLCFDILNNAMYVGNFNYASFIKITLVIFNAGIVCNQMQLAQRISGWIVPNKENGAKQVPALSDEVVREILYNFGRSAAHSIIDFSSVHRSMVNTYASRIGLERFPGKASNEFVVRSWYFDKRSDLLQDRSNIFDFITNENNWFSIAGANIIPLFTEIIMSFVVCPGELSLSKGSTCLAHAGWALPQSHMEIVSERTKSTPIINDANNFIRLSRSESDTFKKDFIEAIQEVIHDEEVPVQQIFETILTNVWRSLSQTTQAEYTEKIKTLLAKDVFVEQRFNHANAVSSFLMGAFKCEPKILLSHETLRFLGRTYNAWHVMLQWLQRDYPNGLGGNKDVWVNTARMYQELNEYDNYLSLLAEEIPETKAGFICEDFCQYIRAKDEYITKRRERETMPESRVWEDNYIECCKKLGQFEVLRDYAISTQNTGMCLEMDIRLNDMQHIKEVVSDATNEEDFGMNNVIAQTLLKLGDKTEQIGREISEALVVGIMNQWLSLPLSSDRAHLKAYNLMQQNFEIKQVDTIVKTRSEKTAKSILIQWRDRLPNQWEDISVWNDFFSWRKAGAASIFRALSMNYTSPHETAWCIDKQSHIFRKHFMPESCLGTLQKIYKLPDIEITEAYYKLKNQIKCQVEIGRPEMGLNVVHGINMDFFTQGQEADFFRLKGDLLHAIGRPNEAYTAFKNAVELCPCLSPVWSSWGNFCKEQLEKILSGVQIGPGYPMGEDATQWALSSVASFMTAIRCLSADFYLDRAEHKKYKPNTKRKIVLHLLRILMLLSLGCATEETRNSFNEFCKRQQKRALVLPAIYLFSPLYAYIVSKEDLEPIWINVVPQLLTGLCRPEASMIMTQLKVIAEKYPQALLQSPFAALEEYHKENVKVSENIAKIHKLLHEKNGMIASQYEQFRTALDRAFKRTDLEKFIIKLEEAYHLSCDSAKPQLSQKDRIPLQQQVSSAIRSLCQSLGGIEELSDIKDSFLADFSSGAFTEETIQKLENWIVSLLRRGTSPACKTANLNRVAKLRSGVRRRGLMECMGDLPQFSGIELPGQPTSFPSRSNHVMVWNVLPIIDKKSLDGNFARLFCIVGNNGKTYAYKYQDCIDAKTGIREWLLAKLLQDLSGILETNTFTRSREINFNMPSISQLSATSRIRNVPGDITSLLEMHWATCPKDVTPYKPLPAHMNANRITQHLLSRAGNWDNLFEVRKSVRQGIAAYGSVGILLGIPACDPRKFMVSTAQNVAYALDVLPEYSETPGKVPFRFTPMLQEIVGEPGGHGALKASFTAMLTALSLSRKKIEDALAMYFRDDHPSSVLWSGDENSESVKVDSESFFMKPAGYAYESKNRVINRLVSLSDPNLNMADRILGTHKRVESMFDDAINKENLGEMSSSWYQWL